MKLINISGSSGVGKTTISNIISAILSNTNNKILHLCGDDLHKWERGDDNWRVVTHLNPNANNIDMGRHNISDLLHGKNIFRDVYNHDSGKFIKDVLFEPSDTIINEGLHALYDDEMCDIADINIFVLTDKPLTVEWKVNRDMVKRGYTKDQVMANINHRKQDEEDYIQPQIGNADVVIKLTRGQNNSVILEFDNITKKDNSDTLLNKVKSFYDTHVEFILNCKKLAMEYTLIQGTGGNLSYKWGDKLVITSSGYGMSEITPLDGFSVCSLGGTPINDKQRRPSMEVGIHTKTPEQITLHTHPIYLNTILCSTRSEEIISEVFDGLVYDYVPYVSPGEDLLSVFSKTNGTGIVLLESHGLICCGESFIEVFNNSLKIDRLCKDWLIKNIKTFKPFTNKIKSNTYDCFIFPDAVVLGDDNSIINNYIIDTQKDVGLIPRCFPKSEINKLKNMEAEKYRTSLK